jgi:hypothetical protein
MLTFALQIFTKINATVIEMRAYSPHLVQTQKMGSMESGESGLFVQEIAETVKMTCQSAKLEYVSAMGHQPYKGWIVLLKDLPWKKGPVGI